MLLSALAIEEMVDSNRHDISFLSAMSDVPNFLSSFWKTTEVRSVSGAQEW